MHSIGQIA